MKVKNFEEESIFQISHEIKNSLAVIKSYTSLFDGSIEKYDKYMPYLNKALDHSIELLKDFSYIGKLDIDLDIMDINYLLEEVINIYKPIMINRGIKLICDNLNEEIYIKGDYKRLKQVFINILENAIDALENIANPLITINVETKEDKVNISFIDNGYGMDEYTLSNIYKPFYTTKKYGTGLGMYITKEIIDMHNGDITCSSNNGTIIKIRLDQYNLV